MKIKSMFLITLMGTFILASVSCSKSKNNGYGGGGDQDPPPSGDDNTINITSTSFPSNFTVKKGTTVKWYNGDNMAHTVTSDDGSTFSSGNLAAGATFTYVANTVGEFPYHCNYHGGMKGKLTVTE